MEAMKTITITAFTERCQRVKNTFFELDKVVDFWNDKNSLTFNNGFFNEAVHDNYLEEINTRMLILSDGRKIYEYINPETNEVIIRSEEQRQLRKGIKQKFSIIKWLFRNGKK